MISGRFPLIFYAHFYLVITEPCKWNPLDIYWFTVFDTIRIELEEGAGPGKAALNLVSFSPIFIRCIHRFLFYFLLKLIFISCKMIQWKCKKPLPNWRT